MISDAKKYIKILFSILLFLVVSIILYITYFSKYYPLPIASHISLDAKIKFIREHINPDEIDTIIVGSSIGLNNIQGAYLEEASEQCMHVLNLSVYESSTLQIERVLELSTAFPKLKRIIYSAQFFDIRDSSRFKVYDSKVVTKYLRHELSFIPYLKLIFDASKNIPFLIQRQFMWTYEHTNNNQFTYLGFDHTGSVPLHIYGKDIIKSRWENPSWVPKKTKKAYKALDTMMKKFAKKGIKYYIIQQPYRKELIKAYPKIKQALNTFTTKGKHLAQENKQYFLNLNDVLPLDDEYFADRSHLNDKGSILTAKKVAEFIDTTE